ncbi:hypothetical protein C0989_002496 [Termitomyces sp. Mn162]|nr:hypothetical protein C0989_002496 [Termitomyces sp. Mn162]
MMEKLTLRFPQASDHTEPPDKIVLMTPRLRHLKLEGYGMSWSSERMDFRNLRSLEMSLTEKMRPSMPQLLAILRQTSRLENLKVIYLSQKTGQHGLESLPLSRDVDSINLGHLQQIDLSDDLAKCALLLSHIIFSKNAHTITLCIQDHQSPPILPAQTLATKIDDGIMGSIVKLQLGSEIRCWKSTDTRQMPSHDAPFTIEISTFLTSVSMVGARNSFCRSLRLHHLLSLVVMGTTLELDTWLMFGDLPCLEDVRVHSNYTNDISLLKVFHRGLANTPGVLPLRPAFAALRRLTIAEWYLDEIETDSELGTGSAMRLLISCLELRKSNQLPLDSLRLEDCGVNGNDVDRLREIIKDVYWDGSGYIDNDEDEGTDCGSYETDEDMWSLHYRGN